MGRQSTMKTRADFFISFFRGIPARFAAAAPRRGPGRALRGALLAAACLALLPSAEARASEMRVITFGGGGLNGNYFAVARAVCDLINQQGRQDIYCSPEATSGSIYNVFGLQSGELDFALVQSDLQRQALTGEGVFTGVEGLSDLRAVMALFPEAATLVVRRDGQITSPLDLEGKVVDLGQPNTARRYMMDRLVTALDLAPTFFKEVRAYAGNAGLDALCAGQIDATILVLGHPNPGLAARLAECDLKLAVMRGPLINAFIEANDDYSAYAIPPAIYAGMPAPVPTFSVSATLMTRADVDDDIVALVTEAILTSLDRLHRDVAVLPNAAKPFERMDGLTAPVHPAALALLQQKAD
jgi:TRAP transporter TAXI family solute receptor